MTSPEDNLKATPEDRMDASPAARGGGFPMKPALIALVVAVGLVLLFYPRGDETPEAPVAQAPEPVPPQPAPQPLPPAEDIPEPAPEPEPEPAPEPAEEAPAPEPPLPAPEESDPLLREEMASVGVDGKLAGLAEGENLLQRAVALVDGGSRGVILRKILPMDAPKAAFPVMREGPQVYMDPAGYDRYDTYVAAVSDIDTQALADSFHEYRSLYEEAYAQLGIPGEDLDNAIIRTLDRILATPEIEEPIALARTSVMYTYADPALEALPALQKQLLRMGPDNIRQIKAVAQQLRNQLLQR